MKEHFELRERVIGQHVSGKSGTQIAKELNIKRRFVYHVIEDYRNGKTTFCPKLKGDEPEKWIDRFEHKSYCIFVPVENIEEVENQMIADITVESQNHSFVAGDGFLSSNSGIKEVRVKMKVLASLFP